MNEPKFTNQLILISLCNEIYKVVSKVIVESLKDCIPTLVSIFQTNFVQGRNIHKNIIVAQELMHSMNKMTGKKSFFAIKVDLLKAYDKLSSEFIWKVLEEIKFPMRMINIIIHGETSVKMNIKCVATRKKYLGE